MQIPEVQEKNPATSETKDSGPGPIGHFIFVEIYVEKIKILIIWFLTILSLEILWVFGHPKTDLRIEAGLQSIWFIYQSFGQSSVWKFIEFQMI